METNDLYQAALDDYKAGWLEAADGKIREFLALHPRHFGALLFRGHLAEVLKRPQEALAIYDTAAQVNPGHGLPFTRSSIIAFRSEFGDPPPARLTEPDRAVVSLSSLGHNGRFGNQLFQYAFVRLYAQEHGLVAQVPDWIGRDLFDLDDPFPAGPLPVVNETQVDVFASLNRESGQVFANCDLEGYFGGHTSRWRKPEEFQALFMPGRRIRGRLDRAMEQIFRRGRTLVGIHIRRGDFGAGGFWLAPTSWYLAWLNSFWSQLDAPILYIATDDAAVLGEFSDFAPLHKAALGVELPGADFYLDHVVLSRAHHLGISNSSFSFTAAMLNVTATSFWRPDPFRHQMTAFDPWSAERGLFPRRNDPCPCGSGKRFKQCCGAG